WLSIQEYYKNIQNEDGSFGYAPQRGGDRRITMTTAGLCGLLIAGLELNERREKIVDGKAQNCGQYGDDKHVAAALSYIADKLRSDFATPHGVFYNMYGIERAGRLSGLRFFGDHDWYREGCEFLVSKQQLEGYWSLPGIQYDSWPVVSTSFALLFLSKG